jgi:hypothetical protein
MEVFNDQDLEEFGYGTFQIVLSSGRKFYERAPVVDEVEKLELKEERADPKDTEETGMEGVTAEASLGSSWKVIRTQQMAMFPQGLFITLFYCLLFLLKIH